MEKVTLTQQDIDGFNPNQLSIVKTSLGLGRDGELLPGTYDAGDNFFRNLVNTQIIKNPTSSVMNDNSGVSGGAGLLDPKIGALAPFINQATQILDSVYASTSEPTQREKDINMGRAALQFFTQMGASASQPGQTALGAANIAGANVAKDYLAKISQREADAKKLEQAKKSSALSLGMQLLGEETKKEIALNKPQTIRTSSRGTQAKYMSKEDATAYFSQFMKPGDPDFENLVSSVTAPNSDMIGRPVVIGSAYQELLPIKKGGDIIGFTLSPSTAGGVPQNIKYANKRLEEIAKYKKDRLANSVNLVPSLNTALDVLLKQDIQTGGLTSLFLPVKSILSQVFQEDQTELQGLEFLRALSYKLAPGMRPPGSGSTSDTEFKAYQQSILDIGNTPFANYLSLYTLKKITENSEVQARAEEELLSSGADAKTINKALDEVDTGIFSKFQATDKDGNPLYETEEERDAAANEWWNSLPDGTVIMNFGTDNKKIFDSGSKFGKAEHLIIKGWENRGK